VATTTDALALLDRSSRYDLPHVIVSDVGAGADPALTLIRALASRPPDRGGSIPTVAVVSFDHPQSKRRVLASGFNRYLAKPFSPDDLAATVRSLLRG
jgi:two-component system, OmpR family, response regulator